LRPPTLSRRLLILVVLFGAAAWTPTAFAADPVVSVSRPIVHVRTVKLPLSVTNVAVHWRGSASARLRIAFSRDGHRFGRHRRVLLDEVGEGTRAGETYGAVMRAQGARLVRIWSDRPLRRVTVVGFRDRGPPLAWPRPQNALRLDAAATTTSAGVAQPNVIPRSGWGADESLRFDASGREIWPPAFYPIQKVIVHHTATQNNDPDPAATIRSIYQYHAVTQGWGDIGYNFVIDESGRIYEGRYSRPYASAESPTGEDLSGNGVTAAHTQGYNSGTVGIALLGTLTNQDATPAARSALEHLTAWIDDTHGIDPQGSALYTNPVSGMQATFANIAGHRDLAATECPGGAFYATLPTIRSDVAALIAAAQPDFSIDAVPSSQSLVQGGSADFSVAVTRTGGFSDPVTLSVTGVPAGTTATFAPNPADSSTLTLATSSTTPAGTYPLTISGTAGAATHSASVTLVVNQPPPPPGPDFLLSAAPASQSILRGGTASYAVSIAPSGGFTDAVTLSVSGLPVGATASFSPNPTSTTSTLSVRTTTTAKTGTYTLSISGTAGALTRTTTVTLQVRRK
jgi:N-acetylmuramoyl-L-alanine amidase